MATKSLTVCDVFGTTRDVRIVEVQLLIEGRPEPESFGPVDLGNRARGRLRKFIERGLAPPKRAAIWKDEEVAEATAQG